jgi:hypothetical protein
VRALLVLDLEARPVRVVPSLGLVLCALDSCLAGCAVGFVGDSLAVAEGPALFAVEPALLSAALGSAVDGVALVLVCVVGAGAERRIIAAPSPPLTRMSEAPKTLKSTVLLVPDFDSTGAAAMVGAGTGASTGLASGEAIPPSPRIALSAGAPSARALMSITLSELGFRSAGLLSAPAESCASENSAEFSLRAPVPLLLLASLAFVEVLADEKKSPLLGFVSGAEVVVFDVDGIGLRAAVSRTSLCVPNRGVSVSACFVME